MPKIYVTPTEKAEALAFLREWAEKCKHCNPAAWTRPSEDPEGPQPCETPLLPKLQGCQRHPGGQEIVWIRCEKYLNQARLWREWDRKRQRPRR